MVIHACNSSTQGLRQKNQEFNYIFNLSHLSFLSIIIIKKSSHHLLFVHEIYSSNLLDKDLEPVTTGLSPSEMKRSPPHSLGVHPSILSKSNLENN